jgi:hypothetical protein
MLFIVLLIGFSIGIRNVSFTYLVLPSLLAIHRLICIDLQQMHTSTRIAPPFASPLIHTVLARTAV